MASVSFRGVGKSFGATRVLHGVSLDVADGEFVALVGPSGCGKTTLLRILAGLEGQDEGEVLIGGRVINDEPPKARDIAMVFQSYALYPYMTVGENVALPLVMRRLSFWQRLPLIGPLVGDARARRAAIEAEVAAVAQSLQIDALLGRKPAQLSGGQRQRVALARAMVRKPAAFLMDEPLSNLDAKLRLQARAEIADLHRRIGGTFIYVTHDQVEAMTMADRVAVMMGGRLLQIAPPRDIYADPADIRVAEFIGAPKINILPGRVAPSGHIEILGAATPLAAPLAAGAAASVGLRPEHLELSAEGRLRGMVRHVEHLGADSYVHAAVDGLSERLVIRLAPDEAAPRIGEAVGVAPAFVRAMVFDQEGKRVPAAPASSRPALQMAS